jgi:isovaleryl-CoA dehydrogenase
VDHVQQLLARIELDAQSAQRVTREAARLGDGRDETALVAIMQAKIAATEAAQRATDLALEATGGQGYTPALDVERHLRDARAGAVMAPTNAVLRGWIGKALAGLPVP